MSYLKLIRQKPEGKAVRGKLYVSQSPSALLGEEGKGKGAADRGPYLLCSTLENLDFIIPPLIYRLTVTYSPKFKRPLPLVNGVPRESPFPALRAPFPLKGQGEGAGGGHPKSSGRSAPLEGGCGEGGASSSGGAQQGSAAHPSTASGGNQLPEQGTRTGIRFHPGSKPEHSRGCILVSREAEERLKALILSEKETMIEINNP